MYLTKVAPWCRVNAWYDQHSRKHCASSEGNSVPMLPAKNTWRKADGLRVSSVRTVIAEDIGLSRSHSGMNAEPAADVRRLWPARQCIVAMLESKNGFGRLTWWQRIRRGSVPSSWSDNLDASTRLPGSCCIVCDMRWSMTHDPDWKGSLRPMKRLSVDLSKESVAEP